jgi:anti-sigma factor RsiW
MDCTLIQGQLIGYHFATVSDDERAEVEGHLLGCTACLRTYLALKTHVDRGTIDDEVPGEAARLRLRAAVQARFRPTPARRVGRWFTRPVPLYQSLAVAAVVFLCGALAPAVARTIHPGPVARAAERVDSARSSAESLTIY